MTTRQRHDRSFKAREEQNLHDQSNSLSWRGFTGFAKQQVRDFGISRSGSSRLKKTPSKLELRKQTLQLRSHRRERKELEKMDVKVTSPMALPTLQEEDPTEIPSPTVNSMAASSEKTMYSESQNSLAKRSQGELVDVILNLRKENSRLRTSQLSMGVVPQRKASRAMGTTAANKDQSLEAKLAECTEQIALLNAELQKERSKAAQAEQNKQITLRKMAEMRKTEGTWYDDDHFCAEVEQLRLTLYDWTRHQTWKITSSPRQSPDKVRTQFRRLFKDTCKQCGDYAMSEPGVALLAEAYVWEFLVNEIFGQYIWAEYGKGKNLAKSLKQWHTTFEEIISRDLEQYTQLLHEYRVATARLVALRDTTESEPYILEAVKEKAKILSKELNMIAIGQVDSDSLVEIFSGAVNLDSQMEQQRSKFEFNSLFSDLCYRKDFTFIRNQMATLNKENDTAEEKRQVNLVTRPGLWKVGNSAGRDYRSTICLLPTVVDLEPRRLSR